MYIVEERYIQYCECKIATMMQNGKLFRDDEGQLWFSHKALPYDDLEFACFRGELEKVTNNTAIDLKLGTAHWNAIGFAMVPGVSNEDLRFKKAGYVKKL